MNKIRKIQCTICNSFILKSNSKRHQETEICKNQTLLTTMTDEEKKAKERKRHQYYKRYYETHKNKAIEQQCEKIQCYLCSSMITINKMNRHQQTDM